MPNGHQTDRQLIEAKYPEIAGMTRLERVEFLARKLLGMLLRSKGGDR